MFSSKTIPARFFANHCPSSQTECWPWLACTDRYGYGRIKDTEKILSAHRLAWFIHFGEIPEGQHVCHHCDNPACVNPSHLFLGSHKDNMKDRAKKLRGARGEKVISHKLTDKDVLSIRQRYARGDSRQTLADMYGVTASNIWSVIKRKTWRHIQ